MKRTVISLEVADRQRADELADKLTEATGIVWSRAAVIRRALREFRPDELVYAKADQNVEDQRNVS